MRKLICFVSFICIFLLSGCGAATTGEVLPAEEYLRIHVRANDNGAEAQRVKLLVKDAVVEYLTPLLSTCKTKEEAKRTVLKNQAKLTEIANGVLSKEGAGYTATATVQSEVFPTRVYNGISLPYGRYEALILSLGKAQGENWWCVVYPPLCFTGESASEPVEYRSFIYDFFCKLIG